MAALAAAAPRARIRRLNSLAAQSMLVVLSSKKARRGVHVAGPPGRPTLTYRRAALPLCRRGRVEPQMPLENFEDLPLDVLEHVHKALAGAKLSAKNVLPVLEVPQPGMRPLTSGTRR